MEHNLVFEAHRLVYHSTLGLRVIKKKKKGDWTLTWRYGMRLVPIVDPSAREAFEIGVLFGGWG